MIFRNPRGAPELACNECGCRWYDRQTNACYECGTPVPQSELDDFGSQVSTSAKVANVLFIAGGAAAVGAILLFVFEDREPSMTRALRVTPSESGAILGVGGTFE